MRIKFWGVRASVPRPLSAAEFRRRLESALELMRASGHLPEDVEVWLQSAPLELAQLLGGETSCIELESDGQRLLLDMGTGARSLGYDLFNRGIKGDFHVLISSSRWEHIQGWPFFGPGYVPGNHIHFFSLNSSAPDAFRRQQHFDHFPVGFEETMSTKSFHPLVEGELQAIGAFQVRALASQAAAPDCAWRIESNNAAALFALSGAAMSRVLEDPAQWMQRLHFAAVASARLSADQIDRVELDLLCQFAAALRQHSPQAQLILSHHDAMAEDDLLHGELQRSIAELARRAGIEAQAAREGAEFSIL
ncbi:MAG: hypothetical protein K1X75_07975 [Leptospirales bacterium]|nr:hypothetical protein [Leptospirales bacterium]